MPLKMRKLIITATYLIIAFQLKAGYGCNGTLDGLTKSFETVILGEITSCIKNGRRQFYS